MPSIPFLPRSERAPDVGGNSAPLRVPSEHSDDAGSAPLRVPSTARPEAGHAKVEEGHANMDLPRSSAGNTTEESVETGSDSDRQAKKARRNRKQIVSAPIPPWRRTRDGHEWPLPRPGHEYDTKIYVHLTKLGLRLLNRSAQLGELDRDRARLPELLLNHAYSKGSRYIETSYESRNTRTRQDRYFTITDEHLLRQADNAAARAIEVWDPNYIARAAELGRKGGKAGKPPREVTLDQFRPFAGLATIAEQQQKLAELGLKHSHSLVKKLRKELRDEQQQNTTQ